MTDTRRIAAAAAARNSRRASRFTVVSRHARTLSLFRQASTPVSASCLSLSPSTSRGNGKSDWLVYMIIVTLSDLPLVERKFCTLQRPKLALGFVTSGSFRADQGTATSRR